MKLWTELSKFAPSASFTLAGRYPDTSDQTQVGVMRLIAKTRGRNAT